MVINRDVFDENEMIQKLPLSDSDNINQQEQSTQMELTISSWDKQESSS